MFQRSLFVSYWPKRLPAFLLNTRRQSRLRKPPFLIFRPRGLLSNRERNESSRRPTQFQRVSSLIPTLRRWNRCFWSRILDSTTGLPEKARKEMETLLEIGCCTLGQERIRKTDLFLRDVTSYDGGILNHRTGCGITTSNS